MISNFFAIDLSFFAVLPAKRHSTWPENKAKIKCRVRPRCIGGTCSCNADMFASKLSNWQLESWIERVEGKI